MKLALKKGQDKIYEICYFNEWMRRYGYYEVYPDEEYQRILHQAGILNEKSTSLLLDVGCGAGAFSVRLSERFRVIGIDLSSQAIKIAAKSARGGVNYVIADIEHLPFKQNTFDLVFTGGSLHHCPSILSSIAREFYNVLKKGGSVYMFEPRALNPGNFYVFHFSADPTKNEKALSPAKLKKVFEKSGFMNFEWKDIGNIIHIYPKNFTGSLKLKRSIISRLVGKFVLICVMILNNFPVLNKFMPGAFFVASCTK